MRGRSGILACAAALAIATLIQPAMAGPQGWYLGLGGGFGRANSTFAWTPDPSFSTATKWAGTVTGTIGYKSVYGVRFELEPNYAKYRVDDVPDVGIGSVTVYGAFFNVIYDWALTPSINFVAGAGAGWQRLNVGINDPPPATTSAARGSETGFAWQVLAGLSAAISDNAEVQLDYRFGGLPGGAFNTDNLALAPPRLKNIRTHTAMLSLRWYPEAQGAYPPPQEPAPPVLLLPPPPPPPRPPPPPPPSVRTFVIFFDFNKSNLTADAQQVVAQAVRTARAAGTVRIVVTGHTDTVGSLSYNQALSERRAEAVKTEMGRLGMDPDDILTIGRNYSDPLAATGAGVREPQNRRAVIDLR